MKASLRTTAAYGGRLQVIALVCGLVSCSEHPVSPHDFSMSASFSDAQADCAVKRVAPIRNLGPGHPNALLPVYDPVTCNQVGTVHDKFMGESLKRYVSEQYILRGVEPNTTFQAHLEIWFNDPTCQQNGAPFVQPSLSFQTDAHGDGRTTLNVAAPGTDGSPIPIQATGLTHCFVYVFEANNGTIRYQTPPTPAYEDVPGKPANQ